MFDVATVRLPSLLAATVLSVGLCAGVARADTFLGDFESGDLSAWTVTGSAWFAQKGCSTVAVTICATHGADFAMSGVPNTASEASVGSITSGPFKVTNTTLSWDAFGWSGKPYNGLSYFQVLDAGRNVLATVATPESDAWVHDTLNLTSIGLVGGSTFYFRATDGSAISQYGWFAMDNLVMGGTALADAVPEPGLLGVVALGSILALGVTRRRRA